MIPVRGLIVLIAAVAILITTCARSRADQIDCAAIRFYVAQHGKAAALAWALKNGYSLQDINAARRCLKEVK